MRKIKKIRLMGILCSFCLLLSMIKLPVYAAGASISASAGQVCPGDVVTFTVSGQGAGSVTLSGAVNATVWLENSSQSFSVTAGAAGTTLSVSISGTMADFVENPVDVPVGGSASVQVIERPQPETPQEPTPPQEDNSDKDDSNDDEEQKQLEEQRKKEEEKKRKEQEEDKKHNLRLKSLSVSKGTLSPSFDPDTYSYDVTVDETVDSIAIDATAADSKVKVKGIGKKLLKEETNVFEIKCSSKETERVNTYTITVHKRARGKVLKNDKDLEFEILNEEMPKLEGFEEVKIQIDGQEVSALKNENMNLVLLYCMDSKGSKDLYIYDETKNEIVSIYIPITLFSRNYAIVDVKEDLSKQKEFEKSQVEIDGQILNGFTFKNKEFKDYSIVYLMDDKGEFNFYQYEASENTLQKYSNAAAITQDMYEELLSKQSQSKVMVMVMMAIISVLIIGGIALVILFKRQI